MPKMIFVNLPVTDLKRATAFYEAIGAVRNPQFSDDTASCMVFSEAIYAMLTTHDKFRQFTPRPISDAAKATEVLVCLSAESRDKVNELVDKAMAAGASSVMPPMDYGFMFGRSFADLDGHIWEIMWMDPAAVQSS